MRTLGGGICKDSLDFGRRFARIHETLGEDSQGFVRLCKRIQRGLRERIHETLEKDSQGFV